MVCPRKRLTFRKGFKMRNNIHTTSAVIGAIVALLGFFGISNFHQLTKITPKPISDRESNPDQRPQKTTVTTPEPTRTEPAPQTPRQEEPVITPPPATESTETQQPKPITTEPTTPSSQPATVVPSNPPPPTYGSSPTDWKNWTCGNINLAFAYPPNWNVKEDVVNDERNVTIRLADNSKLVAFRVRVFQCDNMTPIQVFEKQQTEKQRNDLEYRIKFMRPAKYWNHPGHAWEFTEKSRYGGRLQVRRFGFYKNNDFWEVSFIAPENEFEGNKDIFKGITDSLKF